MLHEGKSLPLGLEAAHDLGGVEARFDDLESDTPLDGLGLLGDPDGSHSAFTELLDELVRADRGADHFGPDRAGRSSEAGGKGVGVCVVQGWMLEEAAGIFVAAQECVDLATECFVGTAGGLQVGLALPDRVSRPPRERSL